MNQNATEWIWEHSHARGVARLVLLAIASRITGPECIAYAGTTMLVRRTGAARSSVRDAIDRLVDSGDLEIVPDAEGPHGRRATGFPAPPRTCARCPIPAALVGR